MIILNIKNTACCFSVEDLPFILTASLFVYPSLLNIFPSKSFLISQIKFVRKYKCVLRCITSIFLISFLSRYQPRTQARKGARLILPLIHLKTMERLGTRLSKDLHYCWSNAINEIQTTGTFEFLWASLRWGRRGRN